MEPDRAFLPSLNQRIAAIVESPTKRTLGFTRGMVVVVVVVEVSTVVSTTVAEVVVVDSLGSEVSAREMDELKLTTKVAQSRPAANRVVDSFITLTTRTTRNFPYPLTAQPYFMCQITTKYQ